MSSPYPVFESQIFLEPIFPPLNHMREPEQSALHGSLASKELGSNSVTSASQQQLLGSLRDAIGSGKYQDLTIDCQGRQWKVHRLIICTRSKFFEKACENNFKEGILGRISLVDDDPELIEKMLLYLYKCDYPKGTGKDNPLVLHAGMYALGDKYDIGHLKYLAMEYFSEALKGHTFKDDFCNAVAIVCSTTPPSDRGLRDCIAPTMKKYWSELRGKEKFINVLKSNCDIAIDLIDHCTASTDKVVN